ncbi:MAG: 23S rRNA (uracil(1939)-C(5))-methyltransferase RlmD [Clostridia bacterium]|jgi:23S rRNA (uracil-5-)-methyltransferase rumA
MNKSSVVKNEKYVVDIIDNGFEGEGIAKIDGLTVFVPGSIKGEKCEILIVKVLASHAYGKIVNIIEKSENRKESDCATYKRCGGCSLRHMTYENTLKLKRQVVQNLVNKGLKKKVEVLETIGMENPYNYRNKAQYPVGLNSEGQPEVGVFAQRTHTIIPIQTCLIQTEISQKIAKTILNFVKEKNIQVYNEENQKGLLRHIVIKVGKYTNQVMCILVVNDSKFNQEQELVKLLCEKYPEIKAIVKNINNKNTNVILGKENINLYGNGYIEDKLGEYIFKISPMSFYQVNPVQAEILYTTAIDQANLDRNDILFDLYCGIGTIGIFASKYVNKVYGIEIVPQAIEDAKENAKINDVKNIEFICGDVEVAFDELINKEKIVPSAIIVDPPRKGLDNKTVENIAKIKPAKLVYISCNPATMVRDLTKLENIYNIKAIQPVDMFPWTNGVESITILEIEQ